MNEQETVKKKSGAKTILWLAILAIILISAAGWWFFVKKQNKSIMIIQRRNPVEIQNIATYGGNWALQMTQNSTVTGTLLPTNMTSISTSNFDFTMPLHEGGKFTANSDIIFQGSGNVEKATASGNIQGKSDISGEIKNGKLVFTVKNSSENCNSQVTIPNMGNFMSFSCYPGKNVEYSIEIEIKDGATTTKTTSDAQSGYTYSGTETWKLIKK